MCISKKKLLMNAFFKVQFTYCSLLWICHSRLMNDKINRLNERCLRIIYNDRTSSSVDLLAKDGSVTNTHMWTELMQGLFGDRQTHYSYRNPHHFAIPSINSVYHGSESISNLESRIWNLVPEGLKELNSISSFKHEI